MLAIRLPAVVVPAVASRGRRPCLEGSGDSAKRNRIRLPPLVRYTLWLTTGARALTGFLTLFLAFLMRERPIEGWSGPVVLGAVVAAASVGNALGTLIGNRRRLAPPEAIATVMAALATLTSIAAAAFYSLGTLVALGLVAGLNSQLAKLSLDALIQRDIPDHARARVFAWVETMLQAAWVLGGGLGIAIPLDPRLGFGLIATLLVGAAVPAPGDGRHYGNRTGENHQ